MNKYFYSRVSTEVMALHIGAETVLFDADDHDLVEKYRWTIGTHGYATTGSGKAQMLFHRLVMSLTDGQIVDHINRNKLDNRKRNLRICSASQNSYNNKQQSNSKSGYRGVVQNNLGKWCAYINNLGHSIYLGMYDTPEEAANAYDSAAAIIAGEFAYRNLPDVPLRPDILLDLESKRRKGRLQPNEYDVILSLHEQGLSQNEIARRIERSVASVQRVIKRGKYKPWQRKDSQQQERIPQKKKHRHPRWLTESQVSAISDYIQAGYESCDIAWAVGCSLSAVNRYKKGDTYR